MKFVILAIILIVAACGEPDKKTGNNDNNVVINNANNANNGNNGNNANCPEGQTSAVVNGAEGCYDDCPQGSCADGFSCTQGICVPDLITLNNGNNANNGNNVNNVNNTTGDICASRADCRVDQECVADSCADHLDCFADYDGECAYDWTNCNDGKEYTVRCELGAVNAFCTCFVNGEATGEIAETIANFCDDPANAHRIANEQCNWLVPQILF